MNWLVLGLVGLKPRSFCAVSARLNRLRENWPSAERFAEKLANGRLVGLKATSLRQK
jgi:hypothetical protein